MITAESDDKIIESDYLYLKGMDNTFNEIWVRISE